MSSREGSPKSGDTASEEEGDKLDNISETIVKEEQPKTEVILKAVVKSEDGIDDYETKAVETNEDDDDNASTSSKKRKRDSKPSLLEADGETIRTGTIRRIMKLDKDVKMTGSEAVFLVSKATELFVSEFVLKAYEKAKGENRKLIKYQDLASTTKDELNLDFLVDLLPDISKIK